MRSRAALRAGCLLELIEPRVLMTGAITGRVFEDFNGNGVFDTTSTIANATVGTIGAAVDQGLAGVTASAFDASGTIRGTATTAADGTFTIAATGTGPYRVEFTTLPNGFNDDPRGTGTGSTVQFVPDGNSNVSLGLINPQDYSVNNPSLVSNQYIYGDPINGPYANSAGLIVYPYSAGSQYGTNSDYTQPTSPNLKVAVSKIGATFGLGYNTTNREIYAASYTKRFAGYGPNAAGTGTTDGAIYSIDRDSGAVSVLADLNAIFGANTAGVDFRSLPSWTGYGTDGGAIAYDSIGKTSLGGLTVSPDGSTVYVMNLSDRRLYAIPTSGPINASTIRSVSIPFNAPGATGINGDDLRPFAVTFYHGQLYVGIVNSAESTQNIADLKAYVYTVDPTSLAFSTAPVFQTALNYTRGLTASYGGSGNPTADWQPWSPTFKTFGANTAAAYAQPMLSGIAFDASGNMVLGLRDRNGDQTGFFTDSNPANPNQAYEGFSAGDTLRAFINIPNNPASGWALENDARGPSGQGSGPQNNNTGPGGGAYYYQQSLPGDHSNVDTGGIAQVPGFPDVVSSAFDPGQTVRTGGVRFLNNTTGATDKAYQVYSTGFNAPPQSTFGKAAGIGDVAFLADSTPIELGDRVYRDLNGNGIQDPNDPAVPGVTVRLYLGTNLVGTATTDAQGLYLFNSSNVSGGVLPNTSYQIRFDNSSNFAAGGALVGTVPTLANVSAIAGSKVALVGGVPIISVTTGGYGSNDHTLDAGFVATGSVAGTVFNDANNNGVFDPGEGVISGVTILLTGTDDLGNTVNLTTTTANDGTYTFNGLRPSGASGYTITETLPTGFLVGKDEAGSIGGTAASPPSTTIAGVVVGPAAVGTGYTFGDLSPASLAGFVYVDANNDGAKQATEMGIAGASITLTGTDDLGNTVNLNTSTLGDGSYNFANLRPSNAAGYTITEAQPAGYLNGKDAAGSQGGTLGNNVIAAVVLASGVAGVNNNFGELRPASLAGFVYVDANNDGVKQASESGIGVTTLTLTGTNDLGTAISLTTTTAADGSYSFNGLRPSNAAGYSITEAQPAGYLIGKDAAGSQGGTVGTGQLSSIVLASGVAGANNNFGELQPASLTGFVYVDANKDNRREATEPPIAGVAIGLTGTDSLGNAVNLTTTTSATGSYLFSGLRPGTYTLTETQPSAYSNGGNTVGTAGGTLSGDTVSAIALSSGAAAANYNFGEIGAVVSGSAFVDANADGTRNNGEAGLAGVTITLLDGSGNTVGTTTTAADGTYSFANLPAGTYSVQETLPTGYGSSTPIVFPITLTTSGQTGVNFGETTSSISGVAFDDTNNNGVFDPGDATIGGSVANLTGTDANGATVNRTISIGGDGLFNFTGLLSGVYSVSVTPIPGLTAGTAVVGTSGGVSSPNADSVATITLATGTSATGYQYPEDGSVLSGTVFVDQNSNGLLDTGDKGLPGVTVTVTLLANGAPPPFVLTTDANGVYSLPGVVAGTGYSITESLPVGYGTTTQTTIMGTTPASGANNLNFGLSSSSLAGVVYLDRNNNATVDAGEPMIAGVTLTLSGTSTAGATVNLSTTTAADGTYLFSGLPSGNYTITEAQPSAYNQGLDSPGNPGGTTTTQDVISAIALPMTTAGVGYNFGEQGATLAGNVIADGTTPVAGVTITLLDGSGNTVGTTTTAANGSYSFANLPAGSYTAQETRPFGYAVLTPASTTLPVTLTTAGSTGQNFALTTSSISGEVFLDLNNNGTPDFGEAPIAGVTITLNGTNAAGQSIIRTTTTAADGTYTFAGLLSGSYSVSKTPPAGYRDGITSPGNAGGTVGTDLVLGIGLGAGRAATSYNFGELGSPIGGTVFNDANSDGSLNSGEVGVGGETISLLNSGGTVIATTTTASDGTYNFANIPAGTYTVQETPAPGYGTSTPVSLPITLTTAGAPAENFGLTTSSLSGVAFLDANRNGVFDPQDVPGAGLPVTLTGMDVDGNSVNRTVLVAANGTYTFTGLLSGTYAVASAPYPGLTQNTATVGTAGGAPGAGNDQVSGITLPAGTAATGYALPATGTSVTGTIYDDSNHNGALDPGEQGVSGIQVTLSGLNANTGQTVTLTAETAADGSYIFPSVVAADATLAITTPPGFASDTPTSNPISVPLTGLTSQNFGLTLASVSGQVYVDSNNDGVRQVTEAPIPNTVVILNGTDAMGRAVHSTMITDANGNYLFDGLMAGTYSVTELQPAPYLNGKETIGNAGGMTGNDVDSGITLVAGQAASGYNYGELSPISLTGFAFVDDRNDGVHETSSPGIAGVTLTLTGTDDLGNPVDLTTISRASGGYTFAGLRPSGAAGYTITETRPTAYLDGKTSIGSQGGTAAGNVLSGIVVTSGLIGTDNDFAELTPAVVTGTVFNDVNDNTQFDKGDGGISGVTVTLTGTDDLGNPINLTTTSNANGTYQFNGLRPSSSVGYTLTEAQPTGYLPGLSPSTGLAVGTNTLSGVIVNPGSTVTAQDSGTTVLANDFGQILPASLSGYVYQDLNNGGAKGTNEPGIAGVTVTLTGYDDQNLPVNLTTTTDANGLYTFSGLRPALGYLRSGSNDGYTVTVTQPSGFLEGKDAAGSLGGLVGNNVIAHVPLTAGIDAISNDFGMLPPGSVAGSVYVDANNDGIIQPGETPIANVTIALTGTDDQGNPVNLSTTTAADGTYAFNGLRPSNGTGYTVTETPPAGYLKGKDTVGSQGGTVGANTFGGIVIAPGNAAVNYNFGQLGTNVLTGSVFNDDNNDGIRQATETPIAGVTVTLTGVNDLGNLVDLTTTTAADGSYTFANLRPSNAAGYTLTEAQPAGYFGGKDAAGSLGGTPASNSITGIMFIQGAAGTNYTFGNLLPASLAGFVYVDANNDGIKEANEVPIAGTLVTLTGTDDLGNPISQTITTAADGSYNFANLRPSDSAGYSIAETQPSGYLSGKNAIGSQGGGLGNDQFKPILLAQGANGFDNNFGELLPASLAGFVYSDANNDGTKQGTENPIAGTNLTLTGNDDLGNPVNLTTTTAADGSYLFDNLRPSDGAGYTVTETQPAGYLGGKTSVGSQGGSFGNHVITKVLLAPGAHGVGNNFAAIRPASLAGFVYLDRNDDGTRQANETPVAGVTLTLTGTDDLGDPVDLATTSGADGSYTFANLRPSGAAGYTVTETQPAGYLNGKDGAGSQGGTVSNGRVSTIVLAPGTAGIGNDFAELSLASLSGVAFVDANNDGIEQAGELALAGVTIELTGTDNQGNPVNLTTTTAADGSYSFGNLLPSGPAGYVLTEVQPSGYVHGKDTSGSLGGSAGIDTVASIPFAFDSVGANYDFAQQLPGSIAGSIYVDSNNNGVEDPGEAGIAGELLVLAGVDDLGNPVSQTVTTDANGLYDFSNLLPSGPGGYTITATPPPGYTHGQSTAGSLGGTANVNVIAGTNVGAAGSGVGYNFGEVPAAITTPPANPSGTLSGAVYVDSNNNGVRDPGESGLPGVALTLTGVDAQGNPINLTTTTALDGTYSFANLPASGPAGYSITEAQPVGYFGGRVNLGTIGGVVVGNQFAAIPVASGATGSGYNFAQLVPASVSGYVYLDTHHNTPKRANDFGVNNIVVTLSGYTDFGQAVSLTTKSDLNGFYSFGNLLPGVYSVTSTIVPSFQTGQAYVGTTGGSICCSNAIMGIPVGPGINAQNYNFSEYIKPGCRLTTPALVADLRNGPTLTGPSPVGPISFTRLKGGSVQVDQPIAYYLPTLHGPQAIATPTPRRHVVAKGSPLTHPVPKAIASAHPVRKASAPRHK